MGRSRKDPYSPHRGNFSRPEEEGRKIVFDNSECIRTSEGGRGLTSYFLRGGGMDVFWTNDPMCLSLPYFVILSCLKPEFVLVKGKYWTWYLNGLTSPSACLPIFG